MTSECTRPFTDSISRCAYFAAQNTHFQEKKFYFTPQLQRKRSFYKIKLVICMQEFVIKRTNF